MAAGTDITHPVSALDGAYKPLPLETILSCCTINGNGHGTVTAPDDSEVAPLVQNMNGQVPVACRPPRSDHRRSASTAELSSLRRSPERPLVQDRIVDTSASTSASVSSENYLPIIRSGGCVDIGSRRNMEDTHLWIDDLVEHAGGLLINSGPSSFYGVFDGHGGVEAASYVRDNLLTKILEDVAFPASMEDALRNAFLQTDLALVDEDCGTTALAAMVFGRTLLVANAGDCRAVLSKRGKAVDMSNDHKPGNVVEMTRILAAGGEVIDGYVNGQLNVARALGDWRLKGLKLEGDAGPLSAEPEVRQAKLTEEDEFLIIGCDGLWDAFTSQSAVDFVRRRLIEHNDPERCSKELIVEALLRKADDNITVVTVCFSPNPPPKPQRYVSKFTRSISAEGLTKLQNALEDM